MITFKFDSRANFLNKIKSLYDNNELQNNFLVYEKTFFSFNDDDNNDILELLDALYKLDESNKIYKEIAEFGKQFKNLISFNEIYDDLAAQYYIYKTNWDNIINCYSRLDVKDI